LESRYMSEKNVN